MAFINEYIPEADIKKYGIEEIDLRYVVGGSRSRQWTIDRELSIYLRHVANGPSEPELFGNGKWTLFWEGELIEIGITSLGGGGAVGQPCWSHKKVRYINLSPHLEAKKDEIIACLRKALLAYKDGGVFSSSTSFSLTLDV